MKKNLTALGLLWIALTSMIGSGWLFGSLYSAHYAGPAAIIAWPLAAFLLFFVALSYAEVATMFPEKDSLVRLPYYTHGHFTSVMMSGLAWISLATIPVIETQGLIQYASNYVPGLIKHDGLHYMTTSLGFIFALAILFSFVILNYFGIRLFARINAVFTLWKLIIPSLTIIILLSYSYHPTNFFNYGGFMPYGWHGVMAAMSSGGVLFSLLGFRQVVVMMSETDNPSKHVPLVLFVSLLFTAILYTLLQFAFIGSLRAEDLTQGWGALSFPGDAGPFAALASLAGIFWLATLLYSDAFISPYSTGLVYSTTASQLLSSMSHVNVAPAKLATKNRYEVPYVGLIINFLLALAMFYLLKNWQAMSAFLVTTLMISYAVGPVSLICLRKSLPKHPRPFCLKCSSFIAYLGFFVCTAGVYWSGWESIVKLFLLMSVVLVIYLVYCYLHKNVVNLELKRSFWLWCYLIGIGIISYCGNFGGLHLFPMYIDLLFLIIFSFIILYLAVFLCNTEIKVL